MRDLLITPVTMSFFLNFQRRLQNWEETEHAQSDPVHCQSVPKRQDLAAKDQAQ